MQIVREWFEKPERNYGLMVRVEYQGENLAVHPGNDIDSVEHVSLAKQEEGLWNM